MNKQYISVLTLGLLSATAGFPQVSNVTLNLTPSRAIGSPQLLVSNVNPNLVEGREFDNPRGVALDTSVSPPILYVSDFANNRVLAWQNGASLNNGQKADLAVGQPDLISTFVGGPGTSFTTGLNHPMGIAVFKGDLYVVDAGNNRVLRYPKPFDQVARGIQFPIPDLFIGQTSLNGRNPNFTGLVNAQGIFLSSGNTIFDSAIAFDASGNLWLVDPGNRRVLRFKAADLAAGGGGQFADLELGQLDLNSTQTPFNAGNSQSRFIVNQFDVPGSLGFDADGNLFVSDSDTNPLTISRILVFTPPFSSGQSAARLMGVFPANLTAAPPQQQIDQVIMFDPEGLFFTATNQVGVLDRQSNRVLIFDPFKNWPTDGSPPLAKQILGQANACPTFPNQACRAANNGNPRSSAATFFQPTGAAYAGGTLYVADTLNNRVLVLPQNADGTFGSAATVLGQDRFDTNSINLIEGKEFQFANGVGTDAGIAIDLSGSTPHLYVSDSGNNRVLGFNDIRTLVPGRPADLVLGQPDMQTALCNPTADATRPTQTSLCRPIGLTVDANGNLYVADSGNGRVLRFPAPFSSGLTAGEAADLVLGQANFTTKITDPSNSTMALPYGVAITGINGLAVSDQGDNRVLYIPFSSNGTFTAGTDNGKPATVVFGQQNFTSRGSGSDDASMNNPHHVAADGEGRIYVADTNNNRVMIFPDPHSIATPATGARMTQPILGLSAPQGVHINKLTGEIWVANSNGSTALRWANYQLLQFGNGPTATIPDSSAGIGFATLAVATDQFGDLFVADTANRVAIFFQGLQALNLANVLPNRALAPGTPASICSAGSNCQLNAAAQFGSASAAAGSFPLPTTLADVQVLFNGRAVPLYGVVPRQINFLIPNDAPVSGNADLLVVQASTGQVLGAGSVPMSPASPGILLPNPTVIGNALGPVQQAAVLNQDSSPNSPTNPAKRGDIIQIFAVGQGFLPDAPLDGSAAPTDHFINTPTLPTVVIGACSVDDAACTKESGEHIKFSGLAPTFAGVWQLNVQVPQNTDITNPQVVIGLIVNGVNSFDFTRYRTFFYVK